MKKIKQFIKKNGALGLFRIAFYPLTLLLTSPYILLRSMGNSTKLLFQSQDKFLHFSVYSSINCLFYKTRWLNIHRYGLTGTSPHIGPGNVNLSRNFHYPLLALRSFVNAGATTILVGMILWLLSHFIWLGEASLLWISIVTFLTFCSTYFYTCTFKQMNYNVVGWMFFPIFLYFLQTQNVLYASAFLLLVSFGSTTAAAIGLALCIGISVITLSPLLLLIPIPALLKLGTHLIPFISAENRASAKTLKEGVGVTNKVKYKRKESKRFGVTELYQLLLFIQFGGVYYVTQHDIPWLFIGGIGLFIINSKFVRFADVQSLYMTMLSLGVPLVIIAENNLLLLLSFWIFSSPIPRIIGFYSHPGVLDILPSSRPYNLKPLLTTVESFLSVIPNKSRLFLAFKNPGNVYENIYDGYRALVEPISYVCNKNYIHMIPDWWYINDHNYEGALDFWGTSPEEVKENLIQVKSEYVVIYEDDQHPFNDEEWHENGFDKMSTLDWKSFQDDFSEHKNLNTQGLKWHLLKFNMIDRE